jgi:GTP pyrophosphokinase
MVSQQSDKIEDQYIKEQLQALIDACPKCQKEDNVKMIYKAFDIANEAHKGMRRRSGEPYIYHPLAVARICVDEIGLTTKGVVAALLHDVVEDTDLTVDDIRNLFGEKVASIVDGLTKLEGAFEQSASQQAENFRKLLLTMIDDVRVILIKLADRLHNMRTLGSMPENKRYKIAGETLYIYAPLAHRLGLNAIKSELEDLSLKYEHPEIYNDIHSRVKENEETYRKVIDRVAKPIAQRLTVEGYQFDIKARPKSVYSIWSKMQKKNVPFEEIYDLLAMRIVFKPLPDIPEKAQCWAIYSMVTDIYKPKPDRLRDWVSTPKANGYEALHTTVMGPEGKWVEVQIRSERMDDIAERGFAAHWKYKGINDNKESELQNWLNRIRETLSNPDANSLEFLDDFKLNLFSSEIMVFTPQGEVRIMPNGSTALDFAFEIHSNLGYKCIGAKVNYKLVPLSHELKSGDQVEIITSEKQEPKYEWLGFVITAKAKSRIKEAFKKERKQYILDGEHELEMALQAKKLAINAKILRKLQNFHNIPVKEDLYFELGKGNIKLDNLDKILAEKTTSKWIRYWKLSFGIKDAPDEDEPLDPKKMLVLSDEKSTRYEVAHCCNPIPGDDVVAYLDEGEKLILHSRKCPEAIKLMSSHGDRIVTSRWESHKILSYLVIVAISGIDSVGIVSQMTKVISLEENINMRSINVESHDGIFEGTLYFYIHNTDDLNNLIGKLMKIKGVHSVVRKDRVSS